MGINTKLLHDYPVVDPYTGASSIPKYQTSTFSQQHLSDPDQDFTYTRFGNPTIEALEKAFCSLEDSTYALSYASGMAAISNVLMLLKSGDHIILPIEVYGGTCQFSTCVLPQYGIDVSFVDMSSIEKIEKEITPETKMIYFETPSNPLLKVTDIKKVCDLAKAHDLLVVADNTFMTSLYQQPLKLGVDIVVESITKFINGHSDVLGGLVATNNKDIYEKLQLFQKNFGGILGVEDAWLTLRGMKTLGLRMKQSINNAEQIADFLSTHKNIKTVYYPTLRTHTGSEIHQQQAKSGGAVLSFELVSEDKIDVFLEKLTLPILAVSLGGVESILSHPATMSHACLCDEERAAQGVTNTLFRLSCGIEDAEDLLADLAQALEI